VGSNSEIQEYNMYSMLYFHRKFSSGITLPQRYPTSNNVISISLVRTGFVTSYI